MNCSSCGTEYEGKFCPQCGAAAPAPAEAGSTEAPPPPPPPPPPSEPAAQPAAAAGGMENNVAGTLCYVLGFITGIIFLVLEPYNRNKEIRFHAFQSIFLNVAMIGVAIALMIVSGILSAILGIFGMLFGLLSLVIWLGWFILWVFLLVKTYQGDKVVLPVIGPLAEKQA